MAGELTPTSYAILGLLALKPWTTYELTQQVERALGKFWPRTQSKLYEEPKRLVAHGFARAKPETVGKRPRTVYAITPKGRRALAAWLPTPSAGPALEFEALIKIFFAEFGSRDDLLATIDGVREWTAETVESGMPIVRGYLAGEGPFPQRLPWILLVGQFLADYEAMVGRWADWAAGVVESWPDDVRRAPVDLGPLEAMGRRSEAYLRRAKRR